MKIFFLIILIFPAMVGVGQSKQESDVLARSQLLHKTVFGSKDSSTLEYLFAKTASYGHSSGKIETRQEAIRNISNNKSRYTDTSLKTFTIDLNKYVAIVRYVMKESETNSEGRVAPLNLSILLVWVKEDGKWKLFGRQAVRLP